MLTPGEGRQVLEFSRQSCKDLAPNIVDLVVTGFGIPLHAIHAPIAGDWTKFNEYDNRGEVSEEMKLWK